MSRQSELERLQEKVFDVLVIGGGINGAVASLTLSSNGYETAMIEQRDFASFTSQESSSLAWGGIKYLESFEFSLVWDLCRSRNELLRAFPSQVREIRFFTSLEKGFRKSRFLIYLGTWLYWVMGRFFTRRPRLLTIGDIEREEPQIDVSRCQGGVEYSDSYFIDTDARFVFNLVRSAIDEGCTAVNYLKATEFSRGKDGVWLVTVRDMRSDRSFQVKAKSIVNATGPYADQLNGQLGIPTEHKHVFSKGIHLIVPKITEKERILTFFADDGRMFFVIPMMDRSCIGTTDTRVHELPAIVTDDDRDFILSNINKRLRLSKKLSRADVIAERCGVRPLVVAREEGDNDDDWMNLSRKHAIEVDEAHQVISIFGGKLTDCLNVGREVLDLVEQFALTKKPTGRQWKRESLTVKAQFYQRARSSGVNEDAMKRIWRRFLDRAFEVVDLYDAEPAMKECILEGSTITKAELVYMAKHEMIVCLEDFLRRRTGLAMKFSQKQLQTAPGMIELCRVLFAEEAHAAYQEYFGAETELSNSTAAQGSRS
ncbi:MAG: FAD-dependent oxidoreductase [Oligoflexus sp.]